MAVLLYHGNSEVYMIGLEPAAAKVRNAAHVHILMKEPEHYNIHQLQICLHITPARPDQSMCMPHVF